MAPKWKFEHPLACAIYIAETADKLGYNNNEDALLNEIVRGYMIFVEDKRKQISVLSNAYKITQRIKTPYYRTEALCHIAHRYINVNKKERALKILSEAFELAKGINSPISKSMRLHEIVDICIKVGKKTQDIVKILSLAYKTAKIIKDANFKSERLADSAIRYIKIGEKKKGLEVLSQALEEAKRIEEPFPKMMVLDKISRQYARLGRFNKAVETALMIDEDEDKSQTALLAWIAVEYAKKGQYDKALKFAETIKDDGYKSEALSGIAGRYAKSRKKAKATEILFRALNIAKGIKVTGKKDEALYWIVEGYMGDAQTIKSRGILSEALKISQLIEDSDFKSVLLSYIVYWYVEADYLEDALKIAESNPDPELKAEDLLLIASKYLKLKQKKKAREILIQAIEISTAMDDTYGKLKLLYKISTFYLSLEDKNKTLEFLKQVFKLAETLDIQLEPTDSHKRDVWRYKACIADRYAEIKQYNQALEVVKTIENIPFKVRALAAVAARYSIHSQQMDNHAGQLWGEIIEKVEK